MLSGNPANISKTYVLCLFVVSIIYAAPTFAIHFAINDHFFSNRLFDEWWNLVRFTKLAVFSVAVSGAYLGIASLLLKRKNLLVVYLIAFNIVYAVGAIVFLNYYQYFGDLLHINQLSAVSNLPAVGGHIYHQLITPSDIVLLMLFPLGLYLTIVFLKKHRSISRPSRRALPAFCLFLCALGVGLWTVQYMRYGSPVKQMYVHGEVMMASRFGLISAYLGMALQSNREVVEVEYPGPIAGHPQESPPISDDLPNIVFVQVESLDAQTVDSKIANKAVMPFLNSLKSRSVYFENFFAHHNGGGSSDAEIATLMSLLPIASHSGLKTAQYDKIDSLIQILEEKDYSTSVFHSNEGSFYNRRYAYSQFGVDNFHDARAFTGEASGWYAKDKEFYKQSVNLLATEIDRSPFFAYLISIQSHGPFRNYAEKTRAGFDFQAFEGSGLVRDYLLTMHEVDSAVQSLFAELHKRKLLTNTIVFLFGDHSSGLFANGSQAGRVPLLIWYRDIEPSTEEQPASLIDVAPTVSSLLGLRFGKTWLGSPLRSMGPRTVLMRNRSTIGLTHGGILQVSHDPRADYHDYIKYSDYLLMGF